MTKPVQYQTAAAMSAAALRDARQTLGAIQALVSRYEQAAVEAPGNWAVALASKDFTEELKSFANRLGA